MKTTKQIDVYVPVKVGKILCHSTRLEELGAFTLFMIWSIGSGYTESQIKATVQLDELVVDEALEDLERWKFAELEYEDKWKLTVTGREYFELICCMDKLKSSDSKFYCCVEMYEGNLELMQDGPVETLSKAELPEDAITLEKKAADLFLFYNDNYGNSLELIKAVLERDHLLDKQYMESLYTTLSLDKETRYRRYRTPPYDLNAAVQKKENCPVRFAVPVAQFQYKRYVVALDEYRTVLDTMERLQQFEQQRPLAGGTILSENAQCILQTYQLEKACEPINIYLDTHTGERIWDPMPESIDLMDRAKAENLLPVENIHRQFRDNGDWRLEETKSDHTYACPVEFQFSELYPAEKEHTDE